MAIRRTTAWTRRALCHASAAVSYGRDASSLRTDDGRAVDLSYGPHAVFIANERGLVIGRPSCLITTLFIRIALTIASLPLYVADAYSDRISYAANRRTDRLTMIIGYRRRFYRLFVAPELCPLIYAH